MEEKGHVNASGGRVESGPEVRLAAPRFDEKSVQRAQPAVPLAARVRAPARSFNMIAVCLGAALAGAAAGILALKLYQRDSRVASDVEARPAALAETAAPVRADVPRAEAPAPAGETGAPAEAETLKAGGTREEAGGEEAAGAGGAPATAPGDAPAPARDDEAALRGALSEWVSATNARDIPRQMNFYDRQVGAFYLARNVSRAAVRAEKSRVFAGASAVEVRAGEPDIRLGPDGRTAVMRFRKRYNIASDGGQARRGEVLQELRWRRTEQGWKIVGERDLRVLQ